MKNIIFGITGASGGILAKRALDFLAGCHDICTHIVFTNTGEKVYNYETEGSPQRDNAEPGDETAGELGRQGNLCAPLILTQPAADETSGELGCQGNLRRDLSRWMASGADFNIYDNDDLFAPIASGSFLVDGMVIMPCSMTTAGKIATGTGGSLLCRAADVCIKEKTRFVIVPRESPLSSIHLENLLTLSRNGVFIMPPVPAFYDRQEEFNSLISGIAGRVLKSAGIENGLYTGWKG